MNKDFDHIFKSKLEQHESPYPSTMWDAIDKEINPRKKNRALFIFPMAFLAIALLSILVWNTYFTESATSQDNSSYVISDILSSEDKTSLADKQNKAISYNENSPDQDDSVISSKEENGIRNSVQQSNILKSVIIDDASTDDGTTGDMTIGVMTKDDLIKGNVAKANENLTTKRRENTTEVNNTLANTGSKNNITSNRLVDQNTALEITKIKMQKSLRRNSITFSQPLLRESNSSSIYKKESFPTDQNLRSDKVVVRDNDGDREISSGTNLNNSLTRYLNPIQDLKSDLNIESLREIEEFDLEVVLPVAATDCPSWVNEKLGLYLEIYGAPEFAMSALTAKSRDSMTIAHQQMREDTESSRMSYSLGGRLLFLTPSGISFKIGMNYSQINEKFSWVDPETERVFTIEDIDQNGDTISVTTYSEFGSEVFSIANSYKSLDIPILIGFEKYTGSKFSLSANAGIYVNITSEQRGMFIDPTGTRNWFTSSEDDFYKAYKNSVGISFFGSLGMMYHWVEGIDIFMEPSLRYYGQSMSLKSYPLNHRFVTVGLHTGIRYRF